MRYRVRGQEEFEVKSVVEVKSEDGETRKHKLALMLLKGSALAIVATAVYGAAVHDFTGLTSVYNEVKAIVGVVVGYYFGKLK